MHQNELINKTGKIIEKISTKLHLIVTAKNILHIYSAKQYQSQYLIYKLM